MIDPTALPTPDPRDAEIAALRAQLAQRDRQIAQLEEQLRAVQEQLAAAQRAGKRQATPFARDQRTATPKKPGRRAGQGPFTRRVAPTPAQVDATLEVPL